jgi:signal transduction histidine kinase
MRIGNRKLALPRGIGVRISALSWLVTLLTLAIFATAIIPAQKKDLLAALSSKARGISSSLQEVMASAAVSEDYTSVVDQCVQVLAGDDAIDYLVVTKNDGFSVLVDRKGWRTQTLGADWRPAERTIRDGITMVPLFGRRIFRSARPFDYSGLEWGWIHVGLSLDDYDRSARSVYRRTGLLAILCVGLSLIASVIYAGRLVRPIASLEAAVGQVSRGDLSARADVRSGDEIERLASAFNQMTASILQRNLILESVRLAAHRFLTAADWRDVIVDVLGNVGLAAHAERACLVEATSHGGGRLLCEWIPDGAPDQVRPGPWEVDGKDHARRLKCGEVVVLGSGTEDPARVARGSRILIPVHLGAEWFGFVSFDDPARGRLWSDAGKDSFRAVAGILGASITRQKAQNALVEAKQTLEVRVEERTRELRDEMDATARAHAELAEAQQRLIEVSRLSGMAEVATGVLHNVGNVLNSVNVSATIVAGRVRDSKIGHLAALIDMLLGHSGALDSFLRNDAKGKRVLPHLADLGAHFAQERQLMLKELEQLTGHIGHIKAIVAIQQDSAKAPGFIEPVSLPSLVEDVLHLLEAGFQRHSIHFVRDIEPTPVIAADKHQIIQILLNLFRNAKQSITASRNPERTIRVRIGRQGEDRVRVEVRDTGVGLPGEHLTRIFAHGFTTKRDGHGFGLHSGSLAAQQMGGSLRAESEGPGRGATFILELPLIAWGPPEERLGA